MILSQISKSMGWPFVIVYIALVAAATFFTFVTMPNSLNSNNWPQTVGAVTHSAVVQTNRHNKIGNRITVYSAKVDYQYAVNGSTYIGDQVMLAEHNTDTHIQKAINTQYAAGAKLNVYYNPDSPEKAVLEPGLSAKNIIIALFLLISILAMGFALFRNARKRRIS